MQQGEDGEPMAHVAIYGSALTELLMLRISRKPALCIWLPKHPNKSHRYSKNRGYRGVTVQFG